MRRMANLLGCTGNIVNPSPLRQGIIASSTHDAETSELILRIPLIGKASLVHYFAAFPLNEAKIQCVAPRGYMKFVAQQDCAAIRVRSRWPRVVGCASNSRRSWRSERNTHIRIQR